MDIITFYINLAHRTDRKRHVENQLNKIGWNYTRFNAILAKDGRIGCTMSHLKVLQQAQNINQPYIAVVEDDIIFQKPDLYRNLLQDFLESDQEWDVLLVGANLVLPWKNGPSATQISSSLARVHRAHTSVGYIVKVSYIPTLITNIREGLEALIRNPHEHGKYAFDSHWMKLQQRDRWYTLLPRTVSQLNGYSDIEKRSISYDNVMVDTPETLQPQIIISIDKIDTLSDALNKIIHATQYSSRILLTGEIPDQLQLYPRVTQLQQLLYTQITTPNELCSDKRQMLLEKCPERCRKVSLTKKYRVIKFTGNETELEKILLLDQLRYGPTVFYYFITKQAQVLDTLLRQRPINFINIVE